MLLLSGFAAAAAPPEHPCSAQQPDSITRVYLDPGFSLCNDWQQQQQLQQQHQQQHQQQQMQQTGYVYTMPSPRCRYPAQDHVGTSHAAFSREYEGGDHLIDIESGTGMTGKLADDIVFIDNKRSAHIVPRGSYVTIREVRRIPSGHSLADIGLDNDVSLGWISIKPKTTTPIMRVEYNVPSNFYSKAALSLATETRLQYTVKLVDVHVYRLKLLEGRGNGPSRFATLARA